MEAATTPTNKRAKYVYMYTVVALPDVKEEDLVARLGREIVPKFQLEGNERSVNHFDMESRFMVIDHINRADKFVWQIRVFLIDLVTHVGLEGDRAGLDLLDFRVRDAIRPFGIPVSLTVLHELAD